MQKGSCVKVGRAEALEGSMLMLRKNNLRDDTWPEVRESPGLIRENSCSTENIYNDGWPERGTMGLRRGQLG